MGLRNVIESTMKITWTHTSLEPPLRVAPLLMNRGWENFDIFPTSSELRTIALFKSTDASHYIFFSFLLSWRVLQWFRCEFTHGLICLRNVDHFSWLIVRVTNESTVLAITVIILAFVVAFCVTQQFFFLYYEPRGTTGSNLLEKEGVGR